MPGRAAVCRIDREPPSAGLKVVRWGGGTPSEQLWSGRVQVAASASGACEGSLPYTRRGTHPVMRDSAPVVGQCPNHGSRKARTGVAHRPEPNADEVTGQRSLLTAVRTVFLKAATGGAPQLLSQVTKVTVSPSHPTPINWF